MLYSPPIQVIRYTNGTMARLTATAHEFVSYDYDPETETGTFVPDEIYIRATFQGKLGLGAWQYSDGGAYRPLTAGTGVTISGLTVTISSDAYIFETGNSAVIRVLADDGVHDDTVTISQIVDPRYVYDRTYTSIEQTNNKIALIASEEQLAQLTTEETFITR